MPPINPHAIPAAQIERFARLYCGLDRDYSSVHITGTVRDDGKVESRVSWTHQPVTSDTYAAHLAGSPIGLCPVKDDATASFAALDVDLWPLDRAAIAAYFKKHDLPVIPVGTKSGGLHATVFAEPGTSAATIRLWLGGLQVALAFPPNKSEVFPKTDTITPPGVGHALSLSYAGDPRRPNRSTRCAIGPDGAILTLEQFLDAAEAARRPAAYFAEPCPAPAWTGPRPEANAAANPEYGAAKGAWNPASGSRHVRINQQYRTLLAVTWPPPDWPTVQAYIDHCCAEAGYTETDMRKHVSRRGGFYDDAKQLMARRSGLKDLELFTSDDVGNAQRYVNRNGHLVKYCAALNQFFVWDTKRWAPEAWSHARSFITTLSEEMRTRGKVLENG